MPNKKVTEENAVLITEEPVDIGETVKKPKQLRGTLVYIGPSIFRTELISGRVFICGDKTIDEVLPDELNRYPLARDMFVTPEEAAKTRAKLNDPKSYLYKEYTELMRLKPKEG